MKINMEIDTERREVIIKDEVGEDSIWMTPEEMDDLLASIVEFSYSRNSDRFVLPSQLFMYLDVRGLLG